MNPPNPDELMKMEEDKDWRGVVNVMEGPLCWKCYRWGTFFTCKKCRRHFHRQCAFMLDGYPHPEFDQPLEVVANCKWKEANLLKCSCCIVEETTRIPSMRKVSTEDLNKALDRFAKDVVTKFDECLMPFLIPLPGTITLLDIKAKASEGMYKTIEQFHGDFKAIMYNIISTHTVESEAGDVIKKIIEVVQEEIGTIIACLECYLKRWDAKGKILNALEYIPANTTPCKVPHPVLWIKEDTYPLWPSKLLQVDRNKIIVQCFRERAVVRVLPFKHDALSFKYQTFSVEFPGSTPTGATWKDARTDCWKYLKNMRTRFGDNGLVVPKKATLFDGDVKAAIKSMFPLYNEEE